MESEEEFLVAHDLAAPGVAVDLLEDVEHFAGYAEALLVHFVIVRSPADGGFLALGAAAHTVGHPLQDAHVFGEAGPEELAVGVLAEPVDVEDAWGDRELALQASQCRK